LAAAASKLLTDKVEEILASDSLFPAVTARQPSGEGILPSQDIRYFIDTGIIRSTREIPDNQIQPASIDLRLWHEAYRVRARFLPGRSTTLLNKATANGLLEKKIDITEPTLLEKGVVYIIPLMESLALPSDVYGIANSKSTTGRLDIFTRLITETGDEFEHVRKGYCGGLYVEVVSRTFPIVVQCGMRLNQLRFVRGRSNPAADDDLKELAKGDGLVLSDENGSGQADINRGLYMTVDLQGNGHSEVVAYQAKKHAPSIDLSRVNHYDRAEFWTPIDRPRNGQFILEPGEFYLLASKQRVRVGPDHAAEMVAYDPTIGDFRAHYAGFFDPGFGYGMRGEIPGTKAVLEVRVHEMPIVLEDDQYVGRLHYYKMAAIPEKVYGVSIGSSYQEQGLALSKQFKPEQQHTSGPASSTAATAKAKDNPETAHCQSIEKPITTEADDDDSILNIAFHDRGEHRLNAKKR
jgi:dCTP deaminase